MTVLIYRFENKRILSGKYYYLNNGGGGPLLNVVYQKGKKITSFVLTFIMLVLCLAAVNNVSFEYFSRYNLDIIQIR